MQVQDIKIKPIEDKSTEPLVLEVKVGDLEVKSDPKPVKGSWAQQFLMQVKGEHVRAAFKLVQG